MSEQNTWRLVRADCLTLLPILALAFYMAFIPHQNYLYPVHIDEWVHLAYSKAMLEAGNITFIDPFSGQSTIGLSFNLEAGFHVFWGVFQKISGISWLTVLRYFPSVILMSTVLSVYVLARREGFGWEAAFFACLIPTTVGILGPAFLVPVSMGLLFIPLSLFLAFNFKTGWSYLALFLFTCFTLSIHAPTSIAAVLILIPYILLNLKGNFKHSLGLTLALAIPFLAPFPWIFDLLLPTAKSLLSLTPVPAYVQLPRVIQAYGYFPIGFCLLGTLLLAMRGNKKSYGLLFGLLALLLMLATFYTFHYGVSILYERGLMFMMLMVGIVAGAGLMGVKNFKLPARLKTPRIIQNIGYILLLPLIGLTLAVSIPAHQDTPYYHMIDQQDYEAFVWIRDNVNQDYDKAILDPWKGTAFTAITQKSIYTRIHAYPVEKDRKAREFLEGGCVDTAFLKENGIGIVYTRQSCSNPNLVEVRKGVYLTEKSEKQ